MRIALGLEYEGAGFCGWQSQAGGGAVQDAVEAAISRVADAATRVVCAGRTDAGVHALAQVVHFDTTAVRPDSAWVRGVNAHLPAAVAVRWAQPVADEFHARFSARGRRYRYILLNRPERPGLMAGRVGWFHRPLEADAMREAAGFMLGEHDFSAFRAAECQAKSPIKTLRRADVARHGDVLVFDFEAGAFLHHMVRNIVGALVYVGKGTHPPAWVGEVLAGRNRARAAPTFEACGLYFAGVDYDPVWRLTVGAGDTALVLP
ncbi:MAG: tRNA pseudouridine(38-40) synthase TruA [Sterolibacteriaceae bacterium]|uniref:tRNA pseudouridine(38-40) synthase TruA n=1 Tax=Sulfuritalea sp. TaxID=2480090 RepID=UPI001A45D446|nr:tRNA pseudouridine(38-40) synthase TruA [Sulfuritalea sp.]MBL8480362.1 tRNA pseudouridine(38-40) synthase TruA [Sterolibacteriaceae bacterium]MBN8476171.1 tRNA pseudouridine(38-40) synthase TruA [Sulfuritalea sp.]